MPTTTTPNMNLVLPVVGQEPGPEYASDNNAAFTAIDQHNHTPGYGVPVPSSGLDISTDLAFQNTNPYQIRSIRLNNNVAPLALAADLTSVYVSGGNLYYNNASGTAVQITNGTSVNAGAGSIGGLPSGTASVTFTGGVYVFQSATATPATIDVGSVIFRNTTASSFGVTVSPVNALAADYNLVWPQIPVTTKIVTLDNSGNFGAAYDVDGSTIVIAANVIKVPTGGITATQLATNSVTTTKIADNNVTPQKLAVRTNGTTVAVGGVAISNGSGNFSTTNTSFVDVTNCTVTIDTLGSPVQLMVIDANSGSTPGTLYLTAGSTSDLTGEFTIVRGASTEVSLAAIAGRFTSGVDPTRTPVGSLTAIDNVAAGTYTYKLQARVTATGNSQTVHIEQARLVAYEL